MVKRPRDYEDQRNNLEAGMLAMVMGKSRCRSYLRQYEVGASRGRRVANAKSTRNLKSHADNRYHLQLQIETASPSTNRTLFRDTTIQPSRYTAHRVQRGNNATAEENRHRERLGHHQQTKEPQRIVTEVHHHKHNPDHNHNHNRTDTNTPNDTVARSHNNCDLLRPCQHDLKALNSCAILLRPASEFS
ncbi:hypothetical protein G7Y89_g4096 [Cudoniella acicularis]|uniref:Uncharacterized protein n=1 Tax=Cudoniella acicularis TaxID=354080 RepID=A0A8H4W4L2_9HELO|nr:hypothetical protein G7Y89_g4096 [Cudoniella acicularis]